MTTFLLIILVLIELARMVLQYRSGKMFVERQEKDYCMASEVKNIASVGINAEHLHLILNDYGKRGYELVSVVVSGHNDKDDCNIYTLFFTRKKGKNFCRITKLLYICNNGCLRAR